MKFKRPGTKGGGAIAKVQCQGCGGHKLLGHICDAPAAAKATLLDFRATKAEAGVCSWPQVRVERAQDGSLFVFIPLCPSTNARQEPAFGRRGLRITTPARDYMDSVARELAPLFSEAIKRWGWKPRTTWDLVWYWLVLPRTSCDPSNYEKISLDTLEKAGAFFDDRYAITRLGGIWFDSKNPGMIFKL